MISKEYEIADTKLRKFESEVSGPTIQNATVRPTIRVDAASANAFYSIIKCAHFNAYYFDDNKMRSKMRNMLF